MGMGVDGEPGRVLLIYPDGVVLVLIESVSDVIRRGVLVQHSFSGAHNLLSR